MLCLHGERSKGTMETRVIACFEPWPNVLSTCPKNFNFEHINQTGQVLWSVLDQAFDNVLLCFSANITYLFTVLQTDDVNILVSAAAYMNAFFLSDCVKHQICCSVNMLAWLLCLHELSLNIQLMLRVFVLICVFFLPLAGRVLPKPGGSHQQGLRLWHPLPSHLWTFLHPRQVEVLWRN